MADNVGEGYIEVGAEDATGDELRRIQKRLEAAMQRAGKSSGEKLVRELRKAADTAGDKMVRELQDDFKIIEHQLNELSEERKIKLQAELEATAARAEILYTARDRVVNLWAVVKGNAAAELTLLAKGLSGLSALQGWKDTLVSFGSTLPQTTLKLGLLGGALTSLVNPLLNLLTTIAPVGADLGKLGGLVNAIPAYAGAAAAGITVLVMAFKNLGDASTDAGQSMYSTLQTIKDRFGELQKVVQGNFAEGFAGPFERLANVVLPQLESGLASVASAMGQQWGAVADQISNVLDGGKLQPFFDNLVKGTQAATPGFADIFEALTTISIKGSDTFERLGEWISKIGGQFRGWADGADIAGIINRGADALVELWTVGKEAWRVVQGIFTAMDTGKSTGLDSLAATLSKVADIVNGANFQTAMTTIFTGASEGASALASALVPIGDAFADLAPTIANLLSTLGGAGATAFTAIAQAIAAPVAQDGLNTAISALAGLITGIDWAGFSPLIGALGSTIEVVATNMTSLVNSIIPYLPGIVSGFGGFASVLGAILPPLVAFLGPLLQMPGVVESILFAFTAWKTITPIVTAIQAAMGLLNSQFVLLAVAKAKDLALTVAISALYAKDFIVGLASTVAALAAQTAAWIANTAASVAQKAALIAGTVATQAAAAAQWLLNAALTANPIGIVVAAIAALVAGLIWFFTKTELGQEIWANFTKFLGEAWDNIVKFITDTVNALVSFFTDAWNNVSNGITSAWTAITGFFKSTWDSIVKTFTTVLVRIISFLSDSWNNIRATIDAVWNGVKAALAAVVQWIVDLFLNWTVYGIIIKNWDSIISFFRTIGGTIQSIFNGAMQWLIQAGSDIMNGLSNGVQNIWNSVVNWFRSIPGAVMGFFAGAGNWLWNAGAEIVNGLLNGLASMAGSIGSFFLSLLPGWIVGPFKAALGIASPSKLFATFGKYIGEGLVKGLTGSQSSITSATEKMASSTSKLFDGLRDQVAESNEVLKGLTAKQQDLAASHAKKMSSLQAKLADAMTPKVSESVKRQLSDENTRYARDVQDYQIRMRRMQEDLAAAQNKRNAAAAAGNSTASADSSIQSLQRRMDDANRDYLRMQNDHQKKVDRLQEGLYKAGTEAQRKSLQEQLENEIQSYAKSNAVLKTKIADEKDLLAQATKGLANQNEAYVKAMTAKATDQINVLADYREQLKEQLKAAQNDLNDAMKVRDNYRNGIRDSINGLFDINKVNSKGSTTSKSMIDSITKQIESVKSFRATIAELTKLGLDDKSIKDLTDKFASSGSSAAADAILKGGPDAIKELASLRAELDKQAEALGTSVSGTLYQAGVDAAAGIVKGLESQIDVIEGMMTKIADALVVAIKDRLGIKSPSRVLAAIGENTAAGFVQGINRRGGEAESSMARMVNPTRIQPATVPSQVDRSSSITNNTRSTVERGAVQVIGTLDAERTAQETVDRMMERLGA